MKKLILLLMTLAAVVVVAVYLLMPSTLNWDKYIRDVEQEIKTQTGLALRYQGKPQFVGGAVPLVRLDKATLSNVPGAEAVLMMKTDSLEIQLDRAQIFKRRIKARKVVLHSPSFNFERLNDGKWNWQIAFVERRVKNEALGFESLLISKGKAEVRPDKYSPATKWSGMNAELLADSVRGPFYFDGNVSTSGTTVGFSMRVDRFDSASSPNLTLRVTHAPSESTVSFSGQYSLASETKGDLNGDVSFEVRKPAALLALVTDQKLPDSVLLPLVGSLKIAEDSVKRERTLSSFVFSYGRSAASGSVKTTFLSAEETARILQIREEIVDEGLVLRDPNDPSVAVNVDKVKTEVKLAEHLLPSDTEASFVFTKLEADPFVAATSDFVRFAEHLFDPRSKDRVTLDLKLDSIEYRNALLRQGAVRIERSENGFDFSGLKVRFPGETDVSASGSVRLAGESATLNARIEAESNNIGDALNWIGYPLSDDRPADIWHLFKGSADITLSSNGFVIRDVRLNPDNAEITGSAAVRYGARPRVALKADVRNFDAKVYFPEADKVVTAFMTARRDKTVSARIRTLSDMLNPLNKVELSASVSANIVDFSELQMENAALDVAVRQGRLELKNFSADNLWNGKIALSGVLEHLGGDLTFMPLNVSFSSDRHNEFLRQSGFSWPLRSVNDFAQMAVTAKINGTADKFGYTLGLSSGDLVLDAAGDFVGTGNEKTGKIELKASDSDFRHFIALFTNKYRPLSPKPGRVEASAGVSFGTNFIKLENVNLSVADAAEMTGSADWAFGADRPRVSAALNFSTLNMKKLLPSLTDGIVAGEETVAAENVFGTDGALTGLERLSFSRNNFNLSFLGDYNAKIDVAAEYAVYGRTEFSNIRGTVRLSPSAAEFKLESASVNGATLTLSTKLSPENNDVRFEGQMNLLDVTIPKTAFASPHLDLAQIEGGALYLNGVGTGRTPYDVMRSFEGTGFAGFRSALLTGLSYSAFPEIFKTASPENIGMLNETIMKGRTPVSKLLANLVFDKGILRSASTQLTYGRERTDLGPAAFNLADGTFTADWVMSLKVFDAPDFKITLEKHPGKELEITENVAETARGFIVKNEDNKRRQQEAQDKAREAREKKITERRQIQRNRLLNEEARFSAELDVLNKRVEELAVYDDVFQAKRYAEQLRLIQKESNELMSEIQSMLSSDSISFDTIQQFRDRIATVLMNKRGEIEEVYAAAVSKGIKGHIYAYLTEANDILTEIIKMKAEYPQIPELEKIQISGMAGLNKLKGMDAKSETRMDEAQLRLLQTEAELTLQAVKADKEKALEKIKVFQAAEEEKKAKERAAEEARLKAEAEAKAAEEARLKAEEEARAAEKKRKQETVFRRSGEASAWHEGNVERKEAPSSGVLSFGDGGSSTGEAAPDAAASPMIIRRR